MAAAGRWPLPHPNTLVIIYLLAEPLHSWLHRVALRQKSSVTTLGYNAVHQDWLHQIP